jgi:hypothetical protein
VSKLLEKDPADRFQSASEVAVLFERCLAHVQQPLTVMLPAVPVPPRLVSERPRWKTRLEIAAGMLVVAIGAGVILNQWGRDREGPGQPDPIASTSQKREVQVVVGPAKKPAWYLDPLEPIPSPPEITFTGRDLDPEFMKMWAGEFGEWAHRFRNQMQTHKSWVKVRKDVGPHPDIVDIVLDHLWDRSIGAEVALTTTRRIERTRLDPIEQEIEDTARRVEQFDRELTLITNRK